MKKRLTIWGYPLVIIGVLLMLTGSCKKKADTTTSTTPKVIGQQYGGGIIFYIDVTGQHGLIAASTDQSSAAQWGCSGTSIPGTSTAIGTGQANTTAIVNGCSTAVIAARICDDFVMNGYSDWFLPSKKELNQMYLQRNFIGGFAYDNGYWSSSESDAGHAWAKNFANSVEPTANKFFTGDVRAVRAF